jgi:serine/threonine protein kinase
MILTCPYCRRSLSSSDVEGPPLFCMYCGHKLRDGPAPGANAAETQPFIPASADLDEEETPDLGAVPASIGGYQLLRLLGKGGMGAVYEAASPETGGRVAVKLLSPRLASNPASVERFRQEGVLASQVAHPRCVFVLSADTDAGRPYIVMELMPGRTLRDVVDSRGPLPAEEAIRYILDAIDGLIEAHRLGMIHRDMKPSNCFLTEDNHVKVGDFGLSKSLSGSQDRHLTQSGAFLGTVLFASPEQIRGEPLDYRADVFSVCATLYYLLCGEAPYQHDSMTAALAKAISEDPPLLREKRPELSRRLEQVVMKGLERSRDRRWQSLDDLREALVGLLPSRRHPARPRALIGAYIVDRIVVSVLSVPLEIALLKWDSDRIEFHLGRMESPAITLGILCIYFGVLEGVFGASVGKWLLGLRVSRLGQSGAPGIARAFLRTAVFHLMLACIVVFPEHMAVWFGSPLGRLCGGALFIIATVLLLIQLRKKWGFRGIHDFVSRCHVTQHPLPARKLRLAIKRPTPLQRLLPAPVEPLPAALGHFTVRGRIAADSSGEQVWLGEDGALARLVLLWLRPKASGSIALAEASRPSRLRRLSGGNVTWSQTDYDWIAFAAPMGGPLVEAIAPGRTLQWADTRYLLEQLVEELRAAEEDGTLPARLGIDQVWAEPNGRLQLLDCAPSDANRQKPRTPLILVRELVSLSLEGQARSSAEPIRAPIPLHAAPLVKRMFSDGAYQSIDELQHDLLETQNQRPEVTPAIRAAQLGMQAASIGWALFAAYLAAFSFGLVLTIEARGHLQEVNAAVEILSDPTARAKLASAKGMDQALKNPKTIRRLREYQDHLKNEVALRQSVMFAPQRLILEQFPEMDSYDVERAVNSADVREAIVWAGKTDRPLHPAPSSPWGPSEMLEQFAVLLALPFVLAIGAAIFRGGLSFMLAGIALLRADGRRASRRQCGLRAALVWAPVTVLLGASAFLQAYHPGRAYLAAVLFLAAVALPPIYVVIALRCPTRAPQDRVVGTYLVPA